MSRQIVGRLRELRWFFALWLRLNHGSRQESPSRVAAVEDGLYSSSVVNTTVPGPQNIIMTKRVRSQKGV